METSEPVFALGFDRAQSDYEGQEPDWEDEDEWDEGRDEAEREYAAEMRAEMRAEREERSWEWR